jgi:hypothetical protein
MDDRKKFASGVVKFVPMVDLVLWRFNFTPHQLGLRARAPSVSPTPPPGRPRERYWSALEFGSNIFVQCLQVKKRLARYAGSPAFFRFESNGFSTYLRPKANFFLP